MHYGEFITFCFSHCSNGKCLLQDTVFCKIHQRERFPQATVLIKLLKCGSLSYGVQSCKDRLLQHGPLLHGPPMASHPPLRHPAALAWGLSMGCGWIPASLWISVGCTMDCTIGYKESPAPPSPLTLVSAELFLSHVLTALLWSQLQVHSNLVLSS